MKLKDHIDKFDESLLEEKKLDKIFSSKNTGMLQEHIERFEASLGESPTIKSTSKKISFSHTEQLQLKIQDKDKLIENLKGESTELTNKVFTLEEEKSTLLEELNRAKWLENNIASTTKKIYEDKIKKMNYVDSSKLIPILIEVSRRKQGNKKLNWGEWIKIPENRYLLQISENIAKKVFEDTNVLIDEAISNINKKRRNYGGDISIVYGLEFNGSDNRIVTDFQDGEEQVALTYSWWMKASVTSIHKGVFGYNDIAGGSFHLNYTSNRPILYLSRGGSQRFHTYFNDTSAQDDGQWHHWMIYQSVTDASTSKLFIDGVSIGVNASVDDGPAGNDHESFDMDAHPTGLNIGSYRNSGHSAVQHFEGSMTNFAVLSGDKTGDVSLHYNNGTPKDLVNETDLIGYWRMDDNGGSTVTDYSGNGNHGTLESSNDNVDLPKWITIGEI